MIRSQFIAFKGVPGSIVHGGVWGKSHDVLEVGESLEEFRLQKVRRVVLRPTFLEESPDLPLVRKFHSLLQLTLR
jgi:hypothetical protein